MANCGYPIRTGRTPAATTKYMWWGIPRQGGGYAYAAHSHVGQLIVVFPQERVVVVRFGKTEGLVDS
jgi:CubicO group peptidase (beta-lactamase class C family)